MTTEQVLVEIVGDLATVTLNRAERRNALSESMLHDLGAAMARAAEAPGVRAVVLAAAGPVFSAGHDFSDMIDRDLDGMRRLLGVCTEVHRRRSAPEPPRGGEWIHRSQLTAEPWRR